MEFYPGRLSKAFSLLEGKNSFDMWNVATMNRLKHFYEEKTFETFVKIPMYDLHGLCPDLGFLSALRADLDVPDTRRRKFTDRWWTKTVRV